MSTQTLPLDETLIRYLAGEVSYPEIRAFLVARIEAGLGETDRTTYAIALLVEKLLDDHTIALLALWSEAAARNGATGAAGGRPPITPVA